MTVTETEAPPAAASAAPALEPPRPAVGFAALLGTGEHRTIGRLWIFTAFAFLLVAGVTGALVGVERIDTAGLGDVLDADVVGQVYSLHAVAGTFLFLLPLFLGIATAVVPGQVGAATVAFPRAAAAAYWTYLAAGAVLIASFVADGGPFGSDGEAVELFVASFLAVLVALVLAAICVASTTLALRTHGMGLHRAPLFAWSSLVTAAVTMLTLPVLAAVLVLVYVDLRYGETLLDGSEGVFGRIAWSWAQPNVYLFAIPVLGIVADVVPVAARTRLTRHRIAMGCIGAFGLFSFGAWAMPSITAEGEASLRYVGEVPFYAFSFLVLLPVLALAGLLGMHVVAASATAGTTAVHGGAAAAAPGATSAQAAHDPAGGLALGPVDAAALLDVVDDAAGGPAGLAMAHAVLACLVLLLLVLWLPRHRPAAELCSRPPARAPARDLVLDLSRLSAALRWRTDPVRQAVLRT